MKVRKTIVISTTQHKPCSRTIINNQGLEITWLVYFILATTTLFRINELMKDNDMVAKVKLMFIDNDNNEQLQVNWLGIILQLRQDIRIDRHRRPQIDNYLIAFQVIYAYISIIFVIILYVLYFPLSITIISSWSYNY